MSAAKPTDKRISWLIAATLLNTALSSSALGLWFFAPNRARETLPPGIASTSSPPPLAARPGVPPRDRLPRRRIDPIAPGPVVPEGPTEALPPARMMNPGSSRASAVKASPATTALAERLHIWPESLAQAFADETGDVPHNVAQRLEQAYDTAQSLAKQRNLDEAQTQSLTTLLTHYVFRVLQEEKKAAPGPVDPTLIEALRENILNSVGTTCGDETRKAAESVIDRQ